MKINVSLDDELVKRIDECADMNYMSRSGLISFACSQYLNTAEAVKAVSDLSLAMRKIADSGTIDNEAKAQLEDFERFARMLQGK